MEKLKLKYKALRQALKILGDAIDLLGAVERRCSGSSTVSICPDDAHTPFSCEKLFRASRDSAIQRFEYCTDLFWKYLKLFLETSGKPPSSTAPVLIVRTCGVAGFISEKQAEQAIKMVKDRNLTSHTYWEELAEQIVEKIPNYYVLMTEVTTSLAPEKLLNTT